MGSDIFNALARRQEVLFLNDTISRDIFIWMAWKLYELRFMAVVEFTCAIWPGLWAIGKSKSLFALTQKKAICLSWPYTCTKNLFRINNLWIKKWYCQIVKRERQREKRNNKHLWAVYSFLALLFFELMFLFPSALYLIFGSMGLHRINNFIALLLVFGLVPY